MTKTTTWLRAESLAAAAALVIAYGATGESWVLFAALFLVPDLSMVGYAAGPRTGALIYNTAHIYAWPALLVGAWAAGLASWALGPGLVWATHIALDRALGYGLKEPDGFRHTHLGRLGGG